MEFFATKVGMSRIVAAESFAVTLLQIKPLKVLEASQDGKKSLIAYAGSKKNNKANTGQQKKYNLSKEFNRFAQLDLNADVGDLDFTALGEAKLLKVSLKTKGRGFTGVIKRHNFHGGPKSHGSRFHRAPGSVGNAEFPGRIIKGKKMPGHYGNSLVSVKAKVISFDKETGILVLKGSIPGANGNLAKLKVLK